MPILRIFSQILAGFCVFSSLIAPAHSREQIIAYTGYLPPLSINKQDKGIAVEIMQLVAEEADIELDIRFAPWKRAQVLAENTPGSLLFSLAYSNKRREKYDYIAPLLYTESAFVTLNKQIDSFEKALEEDQIIGVHLGSYRAKILRRNGLTNLTEIATAEQMSDMLHAGHIDAWYTMSLRASYVSKKRGHDLDQLVIGAPVSHGVQWLAANRDIDPHLKGRLSKAVSKVWRDPRFWEIIDRYAQ